MEQKENKPILLYTFNNWNGFTFKLLNSIENPKISKLFIQSSSKLKKLFSEISQSKYDFIIGLGDYRKTGKRIRIESFYINKYGKNEIEKASKEKYFSTLNILTDDNAYIADNATNGPCNRSGYLISKFIEDNNLNTKFTFIHIPRRMDKIFTLNYLNNVIKNFK